MLNKNDCNFILKTVCSTLKFSYDGSIELSDKMGVYVKYNNNKAYIGAENKTVFARGVMLLIKNIRLGQKEFEIEQMPQFNLCGALLDMSRNAVMKVDAVKEYINNMACLGLNMLMLYTEDTYELKEYPYFGYRRGRYSIDELKEIDDYAYKLGIEVIPCIQTLGHMEQYLRWNEALEVKDTNCVLLCGESKTYELIKVMIKTMRSAFRSKRIHIGMDEAHDVGLGKFLDINGYHNRFDIINRHLHEVLKICKNYDFEPMMWSDMYFRLGSKTRDYYDLNSEMPADKIANIPDVDLVYWDYYHDDEHFYETMINNHKRLGKQIVFAGAIWTWNGFLPNMEITYEHMFPALKSCCKCGVKDVIATIWGDDGAETNYFLSLFGLPLFSEFCYLGEDCKPEDVQEMTEFIYGLSYDYIIAISDFHMGAKFNGKKIFYTDVLYNMTGLSNFDEILETYKKSYETVNNYEVSGMWEQFNKYAMLIFKILIEKCNILNNLREAYTRNDKNYLKNITNKNLHALIIKYKELLAIHQEQWLAYNKVFGWEVINARYAVVIARLEYAISRLSEYCNGKIEKIDELEYSFIEDDEFFWYSFKNVVSTSNIY